MKRILALMTVVMMAVAFSSCSFVTNNYYGQNGSAADKETAAPTEPAKETQPAPEESSVSTAPKDDSPISDPKVNAPVFQYNTPFYGIWVSASKSYDEAADFASNVSSNGFDGYVITTTDWSNLNSEKWYVVTAGKYASENEAARQLDAVKEKYPDAYVKYSGAYTGD